ncbi:MAG: hypothetical protein HY291_09395 [Planctomycetes bacterium]|nr:hypothetical protein [Planctomycetota bacterium]
MAKSPKSSRKSKSERKPAAEPEAPSADPQSGAASSGGASVSGGQPESKTRLLDQLGDALLDIGSEAKRLGKIGVAKVEKYGKMGITKADLEREKLALNSAYAALGKRIVELWDDSPTASVRAGDREVEEEINRVKDLRQKVSELREKLNTLRTDEPQA